MEEDHKYTNHLAKESSPYLLQHAHNPVDWYPWGEAALKKARDENKLLIISIGYAACHWCHVMEHETFEDEEVAELMNEHFVAIKVDREERPDVDQVYMNAVQLITGRGGWPLNAFALPDGKPFYAGTYFPKKDWMKTLNHFVNVQQKDPASLVAQAEKVTQGIQATENIPLMDEEAVFSMTDLDKAFNVLKPNLDHSRGGSDRAPKFPIPSLWEFALHYGYLTENEDALKAVTTILDNMAFGGIYDHVGGGFARYSTDADWHVPHFEKMLYDNAQLVSLYSHAWQLTKDPLYKKVVYETLEFVERELTSPEGGFYSSLDADSEGEEGKFYVWTSDEVEQELGQDAALFKEYYNITKSGNWEHGKNILFRKPGDEAIASKFKISAEELERRIGAGKDRLLKARARRIRPGLDDKILTSWNALVMKGYIDAYRAFGEEKFLQAALRNADLMLGNTVTEEAGIYRNYKDGKASIPAFLDDYAFVISAFIDLYQATFNEQWLYRAQKISDYTITHFFDEQTGMFYYTHNDHADLIARKKEIYDNVIPASNSEMAKNLFTLGTLLDKPEYLKTAEQMLLNIQSQVQQNIYSFSNWGVVETYFISSPYEVAIVGEEFEQKRRKLDQAYLPHTFLLGGRTEGSLALLEFKLIPGQTTIYVCQNKVCKLPVTEVSEALNEIKKR